MTIRRLRSLGLLWLAVLLLAACGTQPATPETAVRQALAPTGKLRAGVYLGSPTSMVIDAKTGEKIGVTIDLGRALARRLGVPFELVEYRLVAEVIDGLKSGAVDFTVTNASAARAQIVDFTPPVIDLELGYLVLPGSPLTSMVDVDRPGMRIGVSRGSSSQVALTKLYKNAQVVPVDSLKMAAQQLTQKQLDAFATNKAVLFQLSDDLPGSRLLDGRWGLEHLAIAIPKGREAGLPYVTQFAGAVQADGQLQTAAARAGLRGTAKPVIP